MIFGCRIVSCLRKPIRTLKRVSFLDLICSHIIVVHASAKAVPFPRRPRGGPHCGVWSSASYFQ